MLLIQGGRVLRPDFESAPADIVVDGDSIADIVPPGTVKDDNVQRIDAAGKLVAPGLVNGHNHAQNNLAKGLFDRYNLETYINAVPWATGRRTVEDHYLSSVIGAAELVRKGCTASYDMFGEFPLPTAAGVEAVARAYADVGVRAAIAPMMADRSSTRRSPDSPTRARPLRGEAKLKCAPRAEPGRVPRCSAGGSNRAHPPGARTDHPASLLGRIHHRVSRPRPGARHRHPDARRRVEDAGHRGAEEVRQDARRAPRCARDHRTGLLRRARGLARRRRPPRLADRGASVSHNPGSNMKLGSGMAAPAACSTAG